jgi:hypothetical protein
MKYILRDEDSQRIIKDFRYHEPKEGQAERYVLIPPSRELSIALTKLEEMTFWANASIARNE